MGLAGPKKRSKIGDDPNNTTWAKSTTGIGHKILSSQGWTPGTYLGAKDAAHASHYSAANASHIRVVLKDDKIGLGAATARAEGQSTFGLGGFQDLLGRLNGKSEVQLEKEQGVRADLGRKLYAEQKWGASKFIRGGFLVGDRIEEEKPVEAGGTVESSVSLEAMEVNTKDGKDGSSNPSADEDVAQKNSKRGKKAEKAMKDGKMDKSTETNAERRNRKAERRARKEAKRLRKLQKGSNRSPYECSAPIKQDGDDKRTTPAPIQTATHAPGSRLNVRQRYIKAKRMASMDPQALREILMMKT